MTKRALIGLIACLVLLFGLCAVANADGSVKLEISISPNIMSEPKKVTVSVKVINVGDDDMPGNVTLYGPNGKTVTDFGDGGSAALKIGSTITCTTSWNVTQTQLDNGKISYQLKYPVYNDDGELVRKTVSASASIKKSTPEPQITVKRTISNTMAKKGDTVTVTYDIENTGDVAVESIKFKENSSIASKTQSIAKLEPNVPGQAKFTVTMGTKDLTSEATITYKAEGGSKTYTTKVEAAKITYGEPSLTAKLEASAKQVNIDETVTLKLTLENTGNVDYQNIRVTDAVQGEMFTNQQLAAKQKLELTKEITVRENGSYVFNIEAMDAAGNTMTLSTGKVDVAAVDPSKKLELQISATSDTDVIYEQPGVVKFSVTVSNPSEVDAKNVKVKASGKDMYTFEEIKAGETKTFKRDVAASMAGQYQFVASTKDQTDNTVEFKSNIIMISYTQPTPEPTKAPTLPAPTRNQLPIPTDAGVPAALGTIQSVLNVLSIVFLALLAVAVVLLAVATVRRTAAKRASDKAYDHLERTSRRDYSKEPSKREENEEEDRKEETKDQDPSEESNDLFTVDLPDDDEVNAVTEPEAELPDSPAPSGEEQSQEEAAAAPQTKRSGRRANRQNDTDVDVNM